MQGNAYNAGVQNTIIALLNIESKVSARVNSGQISFIFGSFFSLVLSRNLFEVPSFGVEEDVDIPSQTDEASTQ